MNLHSFDPDIAARVGLNAAVIYQNIVFWTRKNMANGRHVHDGKVWTYNSVKAMAELFPYLSASQIRTATNRLVEVGLIYEANYNANAYDRTKWYGFPCEMHLSGIANGVAKDREPIPDSKPDSKPDEPIGSLALLAPTPKPKAPDLFSAFWLTYPHRNGAKKGKAAAEKAWAKASKGAASQNDIIAGAERYATDRQVIDGYAKDPATWLNQKGWTDEIELNGNRSNAGTANSNTASRQIAFAARARRTPGADCF